MKKGLIIFILTAILSVGGITTGVAVANTSKKEFIKSLSSTIEEVCERDEIAPFIKILDGGSASIKLNRGNIIDSELFFSGKAYFEKDKIFIKDINIDYLNLNVKGEIYYSNDLFYVKEDNYLRDTIGVKRGKLAKALSDSIFNSNSKSKYSLDSQTYNSLYEMAEEYDKTDLDKSQKELEKVIRKYVKKIYGFICEYGEFDSSRATMRLNGEKTKVKVITLSIDSYGFSEALLDTYNFLKKDDSMRKYIDKYLGGEDAVGLYNEMVFELGLTATELYRDIRENNDIWEMGVQIVTPRNKDRLLKLSLLDNGLEYFSIDFGKEGIKDTNLITILNEGETLAYEIVRDDKTSYQSRVSLSGKDIINLNVDKVKETYNLSYGETSIDGIISKSSNELFITADTIYLGAEEGSKKIGLEVTLKEKDKMPKPEKNITTIDEITDQHMDRWLDKIISYWV